MSYICVGKTVCMKIPSRYEYKTGHSVELLVSGEPYFAALEKTIDEAEKYIHFQTYIVDEDETGIRIINALIRAAKRGVRVYFLLDAYGTSYLTGGLIKSIEDSGIFLRFFSPSFITNGFHLSLRLHHKVILADGDTAIIGGMNVANRYHGSNEKKAWLDFAVKIKGPECARTLDILKKTWNKTFISKQERSSEMVHNPIFQRENIHLKVLQNNWYRNKIEILKSYRYALRHSQNRMIMFASYFLPGRNERRLLRNASRRGVDIKIVLAADSDAPVFKRATSFLYGFILRNNIRIYEYLPSNLHAKVATVDGKWSTIGSYNFNHLSDYGSIELNVDISDTRFSGKFETQLLQIIKRDCRQVTIQDYLRGRSWYKRPFEWFSYQMIRLLMRVMFLLTSRKK